MIVIRAYPPNYREIKKHFAIAGRTDCAFSWGTNRLYFIGTDPISPALMAHETAHGIRQGHEEASIRAWWERYMRDPEFRLEEEVIAHRAEYACLGETFQGKALENHLTSIAKRLASPLYGGMVSIREAEILIAGGG